MKMRLVALWWVAIAACGTIGSNALIEGRNVDAGTLPDGGVSSDGGASPDGGLHQNGNPDAGSADAGLCSAGKLVTALGKNRLLVGASMDGSVSSMPTFDVRYIYLAGGLFDGSTPCTSCATGCTAKGTSCANSAGGCVWWGCWQWDQIPPGDTVRSFISNAKSVGQIPMITYYMFLQASGVTEGPSQIGQATQLALMKRYFADWRFFLQQVGTEKALLHIEPDFWGYAQQNSDNAHMVPAAVATANAADCGAQENSIAGMGKCMIAMVRKYAPNAKVGLHASAWASKIDVLINSNPLLDVAGEAQKVAQFLVACGAADADFVVVEASDRDAGYYQSIGQNRWWDTTNATLPNFTQAFVWARAISDGVGRPLVWWQLPLGNAGLPNVNNQWKDNRVDYFFSHTVDLAKAHSAVIAFGAGVGGQTTPSTDNGNLVSKVNAYVLAGGQALCSP